MSPQLLLTEYQTTPAVALAAAQRDALRRLAPSIAISPTVGTEGAYDLTPGSHVGAIRLDDLELVIAPKLPIGRVLFLVGYAIGQGRWLDLPVVLEETDNLVEAIVPAFAHHVRRAVEHGVLQGYREEDDALPTVRGRWRISDQVARRHGLAPPVEVAFDEFTEDIEPNRLIRAAIERLLRLRVRDERWRTALRAFDNRLAEVRLVRYDARHLPEFTFDRRSEHYRPALGLARLILSSASFDLAPGLAPASAFLVDMNVVFEDFVVTALREALGVSSRTLVQGASGRRLHLDVAERVRLRPDISLWAGERCLFVGDVKYKRVVPADYQHADLYQLTAYAIASELQSGTLIYAAGNSGEEMHVVRNLGKRLLVVPMDLTAPPGELLAQVQVLATRIAPFASAA